MFSLNLTFVKVKRIISIFLSLIILGSSAAITLSTHYCMGRAVDTVLMLGRHDLSCGMPDMDVICETSDHATSVMPSGCCDDEHFSIQIKDDYEKVNVKIALEKSFLYAFTYSYIFHNLIDNEQVVAYSTIYPPPLEQDFQSLYQSFLL
jgi:hypothetical protein